MLAPSKALSLLVVGFILAPQLVLAKDGLPGGTELKTPAIPLPSGVASTNDSHGGRTFTVSVEPSTRPSSSPGVRVEGGQFCSRFGDATGVVTTDLTSRFNALQTQFTQRGDKIRSDFKIVTDTQASNRATADAEVHSKFTDLEAKATTAAQKSAVSDFEAAVKAAVTARRTAVDAANATFKQGLLDSTSTRQAALKQAATDYKAAVQAAIAAARASCTAGVSSQTVRDTLKSALDAAKAKLEAARQAAGKSDDPAIAALKATRKAAVDKANADFKAAIKAALAKLQSVLGVSSSPSPSVSPTPTTAP